MKNIFLTLALLLTVSFAFAGSGLEKQQTVNDANLTIRTESSKLGQNNLNSSENLLEGSFLEIQYVDSGTITNNEIVTCKWRTCRYVNGVRQGCTKWTHGKCTKKDGKLTPIK